MLNRLVIDLFVLICSFAPMEGGGYFTNLVTGDYVDVPSLEDLTFPTVETQEINDMACEAQLVDEQVQPQQGAGRRTSTKGSSKRTKNFDDDEDIAVCSAWLNVSKDPIHGANQTRSSFWGRIRAYFEEHKTTPASRSESSIMHRWLTIQKEVNKFCACYEKVEQRNQSGATIQDMVCFFVRSLIFFNFYLCIWFICEDYYHVQISQALEGVQGIRRRQEVIYSFTMLE